MMIKKNSSNLRIKKLEQAAAKREHRDKQWRIVGYAAVIVMIAIWLFGQYLR